MFVNDPDGSDFYKSEKNIEQTVALWKEIAKKYKDREIIAGYDLLNEPQIPLFNPPETLTDVYTRIVKAVREIDANHMIFLAGAGFFSEDLTIFKKVIDNNQTLTFHYL